MTGAKRTSKKNDGGGSPGTPTGGEAFDAFLSHSSKDKRLAVRLEKGLQRSGVNVWIDHANIRAGGLLLDALQQALQNSQSLVLLWSEPAAASRYVAAEWQAAWHMEKGIIPCRLDNTPLPPFLLRHRYCDFQQSYESGFSELSSVLGGRPHKISRSRPQPRRSERLDGVVDEIAMGQKQVLGSLQSRQPQLAARFQADLNQPMRAALRHYPKNPMVLALAGYHEKNEFMVEREQGNQPDDHRLAEAERYFLDALSVRPDDPSALNGIGSILILRGELDAAEFYVQRAIERAKADGTVYGEAQQDLKIIQLLKRQRDDQLAAYTRHLAALLRTKGN